MLNLGQSLKKVARALDSKDGHGRTWVFTAERKCFKNSLSAFGSGVYSRGGVRGWEWGPKKAKHVCRQMRRTASTWTGVGVWRGRGGFQPIGTLPGLVGGEPKGCGGKLWKPGCMGPAGPRGGLCGRDLPPPPCASDPLGACASWKNEWKCTKCDM